MPTGKTVFPMSLVTNYEMKGQLAVGLACRHSELRNGVANDASNVSTARVVPRRGRTGSSRCASRPGGTRACTRAWWRRVTDLGDGVLGGGPAERGDVPVFRRVRGGRRGRDAAVRDPRSGFGRDGGGVGGNFPSRWRPLI